MKAATINYTHQSPLTCAPANETSQATGITTPKGFMAAAAHTGVKRKRKDLALIMSVVPAQAAAVFTTNVMKAAPILWNQSVLAKSQTVRGIVINSGNANSCTGAQGLVNAESMANAYAECVGVAADRILVASTGVIGVQLPMELITNGIISTAKMLDASQTSGHSAAEGIMTTDTFVKEACEQFEVDGKMVTIGAMAKGSGMIHPNMATMLSFLTTDLNITPELLSAALKESVEETYNMISVDGDTSTNDMVVILANGQAGNRIVDEPDADYAVFCQALKKINTKLAQSIVQDGEGATKFLEVQVQNAPSGMDAKKLARSVVSSSLVKAAFFGEDANWGRIICAMGYSGTSFVPSSVSIAIRSAQGRLALMSAGEPLCVNEILARKVLGERHITIEIDMNSGACGATAWGCDLSYEYVRINGAYRT